MTNTDLLLAKSGFCRLLQYCPDDDSNHIAAHKNNERATWVDDVDVLLAQLWVEDDKVVQSLPKHKAHTDTSEELLCFLPYSKK